jgi:transcriptional regulator with XRE-family HTH domain
MGNDKIINPIGTQIKNRRKSLGMKMGTLVSKLSLLGFEASERTLGYWEANNRLPDSEGWKAIETALMFKIQVPK